MDAIGGNGKGSPLLDKAAYPAAEIARLSGLSQARVRRWLRGYEYSYADEVRRQRPVIRRKGTKSTTYASFLDLIDLLFVKRFLDHGVSLQKVRRALDEAAQILGTDHFARKTFFTDGRNIYLEMKEKGEAILQLLAGGQWVIAPIIQQLAHQIEFASPSGVAYRWYPMGSDGLVVLDPTISFGRPTLRGRGVATSTVYDFYVAENENLEAACSWMDLEKKEVEAVVEFEERIAA
ncbi:MAG TPA: hypothetical protein VGG06_09205 [Thermoanaerobaculia bacterium]